MSIVDIWKATATYSEILKLVYITDILKQILWSFKFVYWQLKRTSTEGVQKLKQIL